MAAVQAPEKVMTNMDKWRELLAGNIRFMSGRPHKTSAMNMITHRRETAEGQAPLAAILACSDSRVVPELIFDASLAEVFTVMTAGNVVDNYAAASLEFCVNVLKSTVIVVMGHNRCGACKAAIAIAKAGGIETPNGPLELLVCCVLPSVDRAKKDMPDADDETLGEYVARWNIVKSVEDMCTISSSLNDSFRSGAIMVVGAMYDIRYGSVRTMRIFSPDEDFDNRDAMDLYELTGGQPW